MKPLLLLPHISIIHVSISKSDYISSLDVFGCYDDSTTHSTSNECYSNSLAHCGAAPRHARAFPHRIDPDSTTAEKGMLCMGGSHGRRLYRVNEAI